MAILSQISLGFKLTIHESSSVRLKPDLLCGPQMSYTRSMAYWLLQIAISPRTTDHMLTSGLWWFAILWLGMFGGAVGSFLTVVWDRLGAGEGFVVPRSRCPECDHLIRWYHNVPVVGWLLLGGRCYDCGSRIPLKHPLIELAFALLFILIGMLVMN